MSCKLQGEGTQRLRFLKPRSTSAEDQQDSRDLPGIQQQLMMSPKAVKEEVQHDIWVESLRLVCLYVQILWVS